MSGFNATPDFNLPPLQIDVGDASRVSDHVSVEVWISPLTLIGVAATLRFTVAVPREEPHLQGHHQDVVDIAMGALVAMLAIVALIRRGWR